MAFRVKDRCFAYGEPLWFLAIAFYGSPSSFRANTMVVPNVDILRLPDRLATNSVEQSPRFDQHSQSQGCRILPILAANG